MSTFILTNKTSTRLKLCQLWEKFQNSTILTMFKCIHSVQHSSKSRSYVPTTLDSAQIFWIFRSVTFELNELLFYLIYLFLHFLFFVGWHDCNLSYFFLRNNNKIKNNHNNNKNSHTLLTVYHSNLVFNMRITIESETRSDYKLSFLHSMFCSPIEKPSNQPIN